MARIKINQFPTSTSIADGDLAVRGDATTGLSYKITWLNVLNYFISKLGNKAIINATTAPLSNSDLQSEYPAALIGDEVICKDVTDGPRIYKKVSSTEWMIIMLQFI